MSSAEDDELAFFGAADPRMRSLVNFWYDEYEPHYRDIWGQLDTIRQVWDRQSYEGKKALLKGSYLFSIVTQREDTPIAEEAMGLFLDGATLRDAFEESGLGPTSKLTWIYQSLMDEKTWDDAMVHIEKGNVQAAHAGLMANTVGVRAAKSGFVLANVGLIGQMCIDTNLINLIETGAFEERVADECTVAEDCFDPDDEDADEMICLAGQCVQPLEEMLEGVDTETYAKMCGGVEAMFPDLAEVLEPYHLQWLLFDVQRYFRFGSGAGSTKGEHLPIAEHAEWFDVANHQTDTLIERIKDLSDRADRVGRVFETHPRYVEYREENPDVTDLTQITHWQHDTEHGGRFDGSDEIHRLIDWAEAGNFGRGVVGEPQPDPAELEREFDRVMEEAIEAGMERERIRAEINEAVDEALGDD